MNKENQSKKTLKELEMAKQAFRERTITLILGGFGLVAALAWNEAIRSLFDTIFKTKGGTIISKFAYAALVTLIVVLVSLQLQKVHKKD